ncbi:unnamed protein product [Malassezia sympodialis ATCC 42132]|uniref:Uncharacterized protein n=1 Tax=Malassezia sympodialis (strain ATCC 42132) TaxID=1230383 RepID=M5E6Q7_MALS4|nr:uncharacterized protein MSY001_0533 [Malassezia sympodialis ATCC 42132]CCU97827.1 unnamed protein product [Malassezia sympodialis ATCC 42132]SHO77796.1 Uncharacterized protein MSYG_2138 [Malassezia sympodialis ATCC 42132]|eukprot:XP_018739160.1 uncharacterized protein MSY001_0533 [Malassezia sympodialis ATCC 42132]
MEELLRSLRNLELAVPNGEQIVSLIDPDPRVEKQLAQQLAVPARVELDEDNSSALMDAALMSGATEAMLQNYNSALRKESEALTSEREKQAKPMRMKRIPTKALMAAQDAAIRRREEERRASTDAHGRLYMPRQIMDTDHTYCSHADISALTLIEADELQAPHRHTGRYLLVQVASRLCLYASCSFVGLTPAGAALSISLAHFTPDLRLHGEALDALLPMGTVLLIREPYVSTHYMGVGGPITGGKGTVGVRVDTPSDVHVLDQAAHELRGVSWAQWMEPPSDDQVVWRQEGPLVRALRAERPVPCISRAKIHANVRTLLAQARAGAAWREVCAADQYGMWEGATGPTAMEDALLRADVLFALRDYGHVLHVLDSVDPESVSSPLADSVRTRREAAALALRLTAQGPSDNTLYTMFQRTLEDPTPRFDYAEFLGPVAVADIPNAGRGLVLTRDVDEGELLLFCRAIGSSYSQDAGCAGVPLLRCNPLAGVTSTTTQVLAATQCLHLMLDRPELAVAFLGLTAGPDTPPSDYVSSVYPLQTGPVLGAKEAVHMRAPNVPAHYVNQVLRFNAFGPAAVPAAAAGQDPMSRSTMPHPLPAILNHACLPNVSSVFFGDFVATRALHPLRRGTQIMHQYVQGEVSYHARQAQLSKHGFQCGCALCRLDERDGHAMLRRRDEMQAREWPPLLERSRALFKGTPPGADAQDAHREMAASLVAYVQEMDTTYSQDRGALRPDLVDGWYRAALHTRVLDEDEAMACARRSLAATGAVLCADGARRVSHLPDLHFDGAIRSMLFLADVLWARGATDEAMAWVDTALHTHTCMIGGGRRLFLQRWGEGRGEHAAPLHAWER